MTKYVVGGVGALLGVLGGLWLMLAPFAQGYQPSGANWADATKTDFWTGIALILVSLVGLIMYALSLVGELRARGIIEKRAKPEPPQVQSQEVAGGQDNNIEQVLLPLVTAMLRDMQQQRGQSQSRAAEREEGESS